MTVRMDVYTVAAARQRAEELARLRRVTQAAPCRPFVHELKTWLEPFDAVVEGIKRYEYRKNDRGFRVGDLLVLAEYDPMADLRSGRALLVRITYLTAGPSFGVPEGYAVLSIAEP